jgi:hypothetical protein
LDQVLSASASLFIAAAASANDSWYEKIAKSDLTKSPTVFLEKTVPNQTLVTTLNVYPNARGIILVRDPREIFLSRIRFNIKRGRKDFGEQVARDHEHWAQMHIDECNSLLHLHRAFADRMISVVRYEDLMSDAASVLAACCEALDVETTPDLISTMVREGTDETGKFGEHRTSTDTRFATGQITSPKHLDSISRGLTSFCDRYAYSHHYP